jgi:hypothetical protein
MSGLVNGDECGKGAMVVLLNGGGKLDYNLTGSKRLVVGGYIGER